MLNKSFSMLINGQLVLQDGQLTAALPGQVLKHTPPIEGAPSTLTRITEAH